jgi:hypothetical protein
VSSGAGSQARRAGLDLAIACLVPVIQLILLVASRALEPWRADDVLTIALVLLQGVPLVARRSHPWPVFVIVLVANSAYYALGRASPEPDGHPSRWRRGRRPEMGEVASDEAARPRRAVSTTRSS